MKNLTIVFLGVVILVMASFMYKNSKTSLYVNFPLEKIETTKHEVPFCLYVFFSKNNCIDCLGIIEKLNTLPAQFKVVGVVPTSDLKKEMELRNKTKAEFVLISNEKYVKYIPPYTPSIVGVSKKGRIFFVLPGVPDMKRFFEFFLMAFYHKTYSYL